MRVRNRRILVWVALVALCGVGLLLLMFLTDLTNVSPIAREGDDVAGGEKQPGESSTMAVDRAQPSEAKTPGAARKTTVTETILDDDVANALLGLEDLPRMTPGEEDRFTEADIEHGESPVMVDFGEYLVKPGEEVEVFVTLTAPALKTLAIPLTFDPEKVAFVEASAVEKSNAFRGRMEFYGRNDKGLLGLLVAGFPGMKNSRECNGEVVASFRMRALAVGDANVAVLRQGVRVVSATSDLAEQAIISAPKILIE